MYTFGLELFFDFAGYSMFVLAISNLMGIQSDQLQQTFSCQEIWRSFGISWHMSLSFWFRDFVFDAHGHGDDEKEIV